LAHIAYQIYDKIVSNYTLANCIAIANQYMCLLLITVCLILINFSQCTGWHSLIHPIKKLYHCQWFIFIKCCIQLAGLI